MAKRADGYSCAKFIASTMGVCLCCSSRRSNGSDHQQEKTGQTPQTDKLGQKLQTVPFVKVESILKQSGGTDRPKHGKRVHFSPARTEELCDDIDRKQLNQILTLITDEDVNEFNQLMQEMKSSGTKHVHDGLPSTRLQLNKRLVAYSQARMQKVDRDVQV
jgi:hypothetical protein